MTKYLTAADAASDGIHIVHEVDHQRFRLIRRSELGDEPLGEAHYNLVGAEGAETIDFDHTFVDPSMRGSGLAALLAQHALTSDVVTGRRITASCWYIAGYLERHPELRS